MAKPKIKLEVANFIAKIRVLQGKTFDPHNTIVNGHRGLLALSESDLIKEFYRVKELVCSNEFHVPAVNYSHWQHPKPTPQELILALREEALRIEITFTEKFLLL